jgi:agmatinase
MMAPQVTNLAIVSLPFEVSTSFRKGTVHGPDAILNELERIDAFELALGRDPFQGIPITTIRPHGTELIDARIQQAVAGRVVGELMDGKGFPVSLGGEHTVSLGPIRASRARGELGIVQLDAHSDLRDSYEGNPLSHACVMRRALDMDVKTLQIGIRSMCEDEARFVQERGLDIVGARQVIDDTSWYALLDKLPQRIYLTIDIDFFDPSDVPAVGTPEPGGPSWDNALSFLAHLFTVKNVVAADIVELMPCPGDDASVRLAARLLGLLVGLKFQD